MGAFCFVVYTQHYYNAPGPLDKNTMVLLPRGQGFQNIVDELAGQHVIEHPVLFKAIAAATGNGRKFKAGEYNFPEHASPAQIMNMLAGGKVVVHKITVPEGWTRRDILALVTGEPALEGDIPPAIKEGSLMPETYYFTHGDTRADIITRMQAAMQSALDTGWAKRKAGLPFSTKEQALTLASIVEKETGIASERGHVASVFINRLHLGMKLQSDPTVVYGIEESGTPLGRQLTTTDLQTPTPYNTYTILGLPPGPIASPGRAAIEAVFNPPDTNDLYFVATGMGGHNFSSSLEEHNRNVQTYRHRLEN